MLAFLTPMSTGGERAHGSTYRLQRRDMLRWLCVFASRSPLLKTFVFWPSRRQSVWLGRLRFAVRIWRSPQLELRCARCAAGDRAERLLIAPQDIRTADPIAADHIYAGHFSLAGKAVSTHGHSPFVVAAPSRAWSEALHGFGWLRHLRAADTALSRANAHALVEDWLNLEARNPRAMDRQVMRDPQVVARRLISWLSQSPIILANADHAFYRRFVGAIENHAVTLERALAGGLQADARLTAIVALTQAGLCLEGGQRPLASRERFCSRANCHSKYCAMAAMSAAIRAFSSNFLSIFFRRGRPS